MRNQLRRIAILQVVTAMQLFAGTVSAQSAQQCSSEGLDPATFRRVIRESFAGLLGSSSEGLPGSYASLDIKDAAATLASTTVADRGIVVGAKASGSVSDGILTALSNQVVSPKFGAAIAVHFLSKDPTSVQFNEASCRAYYNAIRKAEATFALRTVERLNGATRVQLKVDSARIASKIASTITGLGAATTAYVRDSLSLELARLQEAARQVADRQTPDTSAERTDSEHLRAQELRQARQQLEVDGFRIAWWSISYGLSDAKFKLFDASLPLGDQVTDRAFVSQTLGLSYSRYARSAVGSESRFWSSSLDFASEDNLGDLKKHDVTDRTTSRSGATERVVERKYSAYSGTYKPNLRALRLSTDYYRFFFDNGAGALHLFPAATVRDESRPRYTMGLGFLFTARNTAKSGTFLNTELYFTLTDLTQAIDTTRKFWGRSDLGLRFSFPINFLPRS